MGRLVEVVFLPVEAVRVVEVDFFPAAEVRDALRGDLAAGVLVIFPRLAVLLDDVPRAEVELRPVPVDLDRADAVREDERGEAAAFFELLRDEAPRLLVEADFVAFLAAELFFAEPPRPAAGELFFDDVAPREALLTEDDLLPVDLLRDEAAPPFLPAALFLAEVLFELLSEDLDEPELFLELPLLLLDPDDVREPDDLFVVAMLLPSNILFGIFLHQQ